VGGGGNRKTGINFFQLTPRAPLPAPLRVVVYLERVRAELGLGVRARAALGRCVRGVGGGAPKRTGLDLPKELDRSCEGEAPQAEERGVSEQDGGEVDALLGRLRVARKVEDAAKGVGEQGKARGDGCLCERVSGGGGVKKRVPRRGCRGEAPSEPKNARKPHDTSANRPMNGMFSREFWWARCTQLNL